jgi:hypothetical protein
MRPRKIERTPVRVKQAETPHARPQIATVPWAQTIASTSIDGLPLIAGMPAVKGAVHVRMQAIMASQVAKKNDAALTIDEAAQHNTGVWRAQMAGLTGQDGVISIELNGTADTSGFTLRASPGMIDELARFAYGKELIAAESTGITKTAIATVSDKEWHAFERFLADSGGGVQSGGKHVHPLWMYDQSGAGRVVFVVPEGAKAVDVAADVRNIVGLTERDLPTLAPELVANRVQTDLRGKQTMTSLQTAFDLLVRSDVTDPRIAALLDRVQGDVAALRDKMIAKAVEHAKREPVAADAMWPAAQELGLSASGSGVMNTHLLGAVHAAAQGDGAALAQAKSVDDHELAGRRDLAARKLRIIDATQSADPHARIGALKGRVDDEVNRAFAKLDRKLDRAFVDLPPPHMKTLEAVVAKAEDPAAFSAWMKGMIDKVAARTAARAKAGDTVAQARLERGELSTAALREVMAEDMERHGFGVHTIPASAGYLDPKTFWAALDGGKLVDDPYFAVETVVMGLHGQDMHVLQWLFLAEGTPGVADLYKNIVDNYNTRGEDLISRQRDPFLRLFDSPAFQKSVMNPPEFTRLTAPFLANI